MKFKSSVYTQVSGSVGGLTYAHNQGGMYARARSVPTNPRSEYQEVIRSAIRQLSERWGTILTNGQRTLWRLYADEVKLPDAFGDLRNVSGMAHYMRCNVPRIQAELSIIDAAPEIGALPAMTQPTVTCDASDDTFEITFTNSNEWAKTAGGVCYVYASRPQPASVAFFNGPYRFAGTILGGVTPPTSPAEFDCPFAVAEGNKFFVRCRVSIADGALSSPFRCECYCAA